jgi:hypothetical protein
MRAMMLSFGLGFPQALIRLYSIPDDTFDDDEDDDEDDEDGNDE